MESRGQVRLSIPSLYWEHATRWTSLSIFLNIIRWHRNCNMPGPIWPSTQDVWPCYHLWCLLGWSLLVWYYSHLHSSECGPLPVAPQTEPDSGGMCGQKSVFFFSSKHSLRYTALSSQIEWTRYAGLFSPHWVFIQYLMEAHWCPTLYWEVCKER